MDGDFPRELLAKQNLQFGEYRMPAKRNNPESYDAKLNKAAPRKPGTLKVGALTTPEDDTSIAEAAPGSSASFLTGLILSVLFSVVVGAFVFRVRTARV